ncbi:NAD(+)/NADH kinase, partial [Pseudoalteromonas sp. GW168-MNA-CIBAN-0100]
GSQLIDIPKNKLVKLVDLGEQADLAIVVGGDGNMLGAARVLARFNIAVIGVNRGNLGFLTDLNPEGFEASLEQVLSGEYVEEKRFLLEVEVYR